MSYTDLTNAVSNEAVNSTYLYSTAELGTTRAGQRYVGYVKSRSLPGYYSLL